MIWIQLYFNLIQCRLVFDLCTLIFVRWHCCPLNSMHNQYSFKRWIIIQIANLLHTIAFEIVHPVGSMFQMTQYTQSLFNRKPQHFFSIESYSIFSTIVIKWAGEMANKTNEKNVTPSAGKIEMKPQWKRHESTLNSNSIHKTQVKRN